jgi:translation elongation factor EF-1beta
MVEYNVAADLKIFVDKPSSVPHVKIGIEKIAKVQRFWEEDVGFGIKVLKATLLMNDDSGGMDKLESAIRKIPGVSELEVENVTRV